jgi:hypothetical protein
MAYAMCILAPIINIPDRASLQVINALGAIFSVINQ